MRHAVSRISRTTAPPGTRGWVRGVHGPDSVIKSSQDGLWYFAPESAHDEYTASAPIWETEAEASREPPRPRRRRNRRVASTHAARTAPEDGEPDTLGALKARIDAMPTIDDALRALRALEGT